MKNVPILQNPSTSKFFVQTQYGGRATRFVTFDGLNPASNSFPPAKNVMEVFFRFSFITSNQPEAFYLKDYFGWFGWSLKAKMVEKSDNVKDSSKLKFYTVLVHEELYAKWRIVITTCSENCRRLPKNERRFPLLGNRPSSDLVEMFFLEYASKFSNSTHIVSTIRTLASIKKLMSSLAYFLQLSKFVHSHEKRKGKGENSKSRRNF